jgi:hypothetical protein
VPHPWDEAAFMMLGRPGKIRRMNPFGSGDDPGPPTPLFSGRDFEYFRERKKGKEKEEAEEEDRLQKEKELIQEEKERGKSKDEAFWSEVRARARQDDEDDELMDILHDRDRPKPGDNEDKNDNENENENDNGPGGPGLGAFLQADDSDRPDSGANENDNENENDNGQGGPDLACSSSQPYGIPPPSWSSESQPKVSDPSLEDDNEDENENDNENYKDNDNENDNKENDNDQALVYRPGCFSDGPREEVANDPLGEVEAGWARWKRKMVENKEAMSQEIARLKEKEVKLLEVLIQKGASEVMTPQEKVKFLLGRPAPGRPEVHGGGEGLLGCPAPERLELHGGGEGLRAPGPPAPDPAQILNLPQNSFRRRLLEMRMGPSEEEKAAGRRRADERWEERAEKERTLLKEYEEGLEAARQDMSMRAAILSTPRNRRHYVDMGGFFTGLRIITRSAADRARDEDLLLKMKDPVLWERLQDPHSSGSSLPDRSGTAGASGEQPETVPWRPETVPWLPETVPWLPQPAVGDDE